MSEKIFRDTRIQIGILKSRGVIIKNKKWAKQIIRTINYYNLVNGYKEPFLQTGTTYEKYISGTALEEIHALYEFDRKLRIITLEYILEAEKQAKSLIAYSFSKAHGHKNYLKLENFDTQGTQKYSQVCDLLSNLYRKINSNIDKDLSISHYVNGKNYIPLWVLVNSISIGDISKFYSNMLQKERDDVERCHLLRPQAGIFQRQRRRLLICRRLWRALRRNPPRLRRPRMDLLPPVQQGRRHIFRLGQL